MKIIDGIKHYTINEILDMVNEKCNTNVKKENNIWQWFYRHNFNVVKTCWKGTCYYYREDVVNDIVNYYYRRFEIARLKKNNHIKQRIKELNRENKEFLKKYKKN